MAPQIGRVLLPYALPTFVLFIFTFVPDSPLAFSLPAFTLLFRLHGQLYHLVQHHHYQVLPPDVNQRGMKSV